MRSASKFIHAIHSARRVAECRHLLHRAAAFLTAGTPTGTTDVINGFPSLATATRKLNSGPQLRSSHAYGRSIHTSASGLQQAAHADASSSAADAGGPLALYLDGRARGSYRSDPRQEVTIAMLQDLYVNLTTHVAQPVGRRRPSGLTMVDSVTSGSGGSTRGSTGKASKGKWWSGLTELVGAASSDAPKPFSGEAHGHHPAVQGLYMYGGVGCGKTMLMDLFVKSAPKEFGVVRTHFHDFMLGVHAKLRQYKGEEDPLLRVADQISRGTKVLALDEFFVTDVADAMILNRLFSRLWDRGLVLVATSNRHPDKLYEGGLQRNLFLPFIHRLKRECKSHDMASTTDYRRLAQHQRGLYFVTPSRDEELYEEFVEAAHGAVVQLATIEVMMGRQMEVPQAAGKVCMFSFSDLCARPVAAADYIAITQHYHTVAVSGVPVFTGANRSEAYRFVTLIDVMYEHRVRMLLSAEAMPFELFENIVTQADAAANPALKERPNIIVDDNLGFAKDRTISRLTEMQSLEYLLSHAQTHIPENVLALQEAQAKLVAGKAAAA